MPTSMLRFFMTTWSPEDDVTEEGTVPVPNIGDEYQLNYEGVSNPLYLCGAPQDSHNH